MILRSATENEQINHGYFMCPLINYFLRMKGYILLLLTVICILYSCKPEKRYSADKSSVRTYEGEYLNRVAWKIYGGSNSGNGNNIFGCPRFDNASLIP